MKYIKTIISIVLLLTTFNIVKGQDSLTKSASEINKIENPNAIFFAPFNMFDIINPNFQIGYERVISKKWSLQIEGGIVINHSIPNYIVDWAKGINVSKCPYTNKGFRVKGSVKYFLKNKKVFKFYISPELFYSRNDARIMNDFEVSDPDFEYSFGKVTEREGYTNYYTQAFDNDEQKMGLNLKAGIKLHFGKHFFIEPHFGIGVAYRNVTQTGRENPNDKLWSAWGIFDQAAENKWVPTIPINLKIGVRF